MKTVRRIEKLLFVVLIFLIPTQLALHFWPSWSFVFGLRVDYLSPTIYLTDLLLVLLLIYWMRNDWRWIVNQTLRKRYWFISLLILVFFNVIFSSSLYPSLYKWTKTIEMILFGLYVYRNRKFDRELLFTLFVSAIFFSVIGVVQFLRGSTIGGALYFLGERSFTLGTPGIALVHLFGRDFLRAYSTFPHPNSLVGFLGVVILLSPKIEIPSIYKYAGLFILIGCFLLGFSLGALISIGVVITLLIFRISRRLPIIIFFALVVISLLLPLVTKNILDSNTIQESAVTQRLDLAYISGQMISERFLTGQGLNTFVVNVPRFQTLTTYQWLLQPVHNIFLLIFSELGIMGLILFCYVIFLSLTKAVKQNNISLILVMLFILSTGTLDHYWLTLQQNILLFSLIVGLSFREAKL